MKTQDIVI